VAGVVGPAPAVHRRGSPAGSSLFWLGLWLPASVLLAFILLPLLRLLTEQPAGTVASAAQLADVRASIRTSLEAAAASAALAALLGTPLAYLLARGRFPGRAVVGALVDLPLAVPHTVAGIALLFVFGRRTFLGTLSQRWLGLGFYGTFAGVVIAMLFVSAPYAVNAARFGFEGADPRLERVAQSLGSSRFEAFRRISLPLAVRGVLTGVVLTYARSISEIGSVLVLAYYPMTAPVKIYTLFLEASLQEASAAAVLLLLVTLSTFLLLRALSTSRLLRAGTWS
jgi:molybdate/tungstate transport system permease protein